MGSIFWANLDSKRKERQMATHVLSKKLHQCIFRLVVGSCLNAFLGFLALAEFELREYRFAARRDKAIMQLQNWSLQQEEAR